MATIPDRPHTLHNPHLPDTPHLPDASDHQADSLYPLPRGEEKYSVGEVTALARASEAMTAYSVEAGPAQRAEVHAALHHALEVVAQAEAAASGQGSVDKNAFATLLAQASTDREAAIRAIRDGFPASIIKDAAAFFGLSATRIRAVVQLPETTAHTLTKRGARLDPAVSERFWRLADVFSMAASVFEEEAAATAWLVARNRTFGDVAPIDCLDTEPGAMSVRQVLNAIATGGAA